MEARRQRILEEAAQVERDMRELERIVLEYKLRVVADPEGFVSGEQRERGIPHGAKEEAEAIIRATGYPMAVTDIAQKLMERGFEFDTARSYASTLTASLLRSDDLRYIPKVGWWLKNVSWPPSADDLDALTKPKEERQKGRRRSAEKERLYQELRKFLEGRKQPTLFRDIFDHLIKLDIPIGGRDPKGNLSAFMTSIHEFRSHGPGGRGGWTFEADEEWDVIDGFKGEELNDPAWRHHPLKLKIIDATRNILKGRTERTQTQDLFREIKAAGFDFSGVRNERTYLASVLTDVPYFSVVWKQGWLYHPELDEDKDGEPSSDN
jgi:hypothetical protein